MKTFASKLKSLWNSMVNVMKKPYSRAVIIISAFAVLSAVAIAPVIARYVSTVSAPFNDNGEEKEYMDFTVNTVFVVDDQNDLFAAINQGYSYIQISGELHNPLVITQSPKNLTTDLIVDLNGEELYRHGNEPIFEISEGVRLTITDTSDNQTGCLYNPTGSVLKIDGGNLTVVSGKFECGPRYSEYYTYNNNILSDKSHKRTIVDNEPQLVDLYIRRGEGKDATFDNFKDRTVPIITAYNDIALGQDHPHGNVYFDWTVQVGSETDKSKNFEIPADTYCYYTTEQDDSYDIMKLTAYKADWYYTYHVKHDTFEYVATPDENSIEVTVYGYENTIEIAETRADPGDIDQPSNNFFAAIKMYGGVFDILYGDFYNYFGVNTTACVDMMGGELIIKEGNFSTRVPNASSHKHHYVDAKENDAEAFDPFDYFNDFLWGKYIDNGIDYDDDWFGTENDPDYKFYKDGIRAYKGEGYGILTSGDAKITIGNGNFFSSNNNLIHMQNGKLDIGGGNFYKVNTHHLGGYAHSDTAIFMHNGELNIGEANYTIYGDYARAIRMIDGKLDINGASCVIHGDYSYAVYSTIPGNNLTLTDIKFDMHARTGIGKLVGIYSEKPEGAESGTVSVKTTDGSESYIKIQGPESVAIYANGGDVYSQGCTYTIDGNFSAGIYANEGKVKIDGGHIDLHSNINCYGIYAITKSEDVEVQVDVANAHIDVGYVDSATPPTTVHTDCKACIGVFLGSANENSRVTLDNSNVHSYEIGVALSGGNLVIRDSDSTPNNIKTNRGSAVAVSNGDLVFAEGGRYELTSFNTTQGYFQNSYEMTVPYLKDNGGNYEIIGVIYPNTDGIYVNGGSFTSNGDLNLVHTGLQNQLHYYDENGNELTYVYNTLVVTSYAVRVLGGNVNITKANITNHSGGGICSSGDGTIILGNENTVQNDIIVLAAGEDYVEQDSGAGNLNGTYDAIGINPDRTLDGWQCQKSITGGHAIELNGGDIVVYGGSYTANFGNGIAANSHGTITVYNGFFDGKMTTSYEDNDLFFKQSGPGAYYGLKVIGGANVIIHNGTFDGGNGGAFVTGVDRFVSVNDYGSTTGKMANVLVYSGTFGTGQNLDSFNVYDYSNVVFGAAKSGTYASANEYKNAIMMKAVNASIATNKLTNGEGDTSLITSSNVYIYYGSYCDTNAAGTQPGGIWNDNATITIYNRNHGYVTYDGVGGNSPEIFEDEENPVYYQ